ncbi:hypothetical protein Cfor_06951 [Coptotermes formosanus]|uniref:Uncharacterized protein n=1 Tax=Coptotermes formosanus TaxID=36987 RepID=A0A6L2PGJ3_COPFO|nr:hypothetical protein Cfor_06951 [Coptotermes formosanus]
MQEKFEHIWDSQEFGTNYSIAIMGRNKDHTKESNKAWVNFTTPDCSYFYPNDLTKCVTIIFLELPKSVQYSVP